MHIPTYRACLLVGVLFLTGALLADAVHRAEAIGYNYVFVSVSGGGRVTSSPAGISCPGTCSFPFFNGTSVTLFEAPAPGWKFSGWSGACTGTAPQCVLPAYGGSSTSANFNEILGDFDGDGKSDILWRDDNGTLAMWLMDVFQT